jgi:hypothetical protein
VIHERDSNGNTRTRYETYTVEVTTYRETSYFSYAGWRDDSGAYHGMTLYPIVKLKLHKLLTWADEDSRMRFFGAFAAFQARNRWRDTHFTSSWDMNVNRFENSVLALSQPADRPFWLNLQCFCLTSLLGLTWCFRWILTKSSVEADFTIRKVIKC